MGIVFNNAIRNGGNMPKIQATTDYTTITGQLNSIALDTSSNVLYYWDPTVPEWIALNGGGAPSLQNVLNTGNTASGVGIEITGANIQVENSSFYCFDTSILGAVIANAEGYEYKSSISTQSYWKIYKDPISSGIWQKVKSSIGDYIILKPSAISGNIEVVYPNTSGQLYNLVFAAVTLVNGVGIYVNTGGSNNIVIGVIITNTNGSSSLAHAYKYSAVGTTITVTALKQNGATETNDQSILTVTIAK
jgi:hypothetical protein